jgi:hypothetical protein
MDPKYPHVTVHLSSDMLPFSIIHKTMLAMSEAGIEHSELAEYKSECVDPAHKKEYSTVLRITGKWVSVNTSPAGTVSE